ncbi:hypothetical protein N0V86_000454 [Didymella sp. IMI 355093]|nr:hypothetical protein N0V86_000454 [Didymella sp. IMI 355093]
MATTPSLSEPALYTASDLESDPSLVSQITDLINDAFTRSKKLDPVKWRQGERRRFPTDDLYFEMLGTEGIATVIFDSTEGKRKVVAVAGAVPWQGGWKQEGAGVEEGWEIKAVAVDGDAKYLRQGLAVRLYAFLEQHLILKSKQLGFSTTGREFDSTDRLTLWILAAECINGSYWRKRGYQLVRKEVAEPPTWGVLTSFEMIVLRKDISFELAETELPHVVEKVDEPARSEVAVN